MELVRLPSGNGISSLALLPTADPAQLDRLLLSLLQRQNALFPLYYRSSIRCRLVGSATVAYCRLLVLKSGAASFRSNKAAE